MNLAQLIKFVPHKTAYAHCDIPCGVYDPHNAQVGAHTVIRMTKLLSDVDRSNEIKAEHDIARLAHVKEEHGELIERELTTLQNDYFKKDHFEKFDNLNDLFAKAVGLSVKARQEINLESAEELLGVIMQIAEIFYQTKNVKHKRVKSVYPTGLEIVVQD